MADVGGGAAAGAERRGRAARDGHRLAGDSLRDGARRPYHRVLRAIIRAWRLRSDFLPGDLFADPAWDILLELMAARLEGQQVSVSTLCGAAAVPPTTALRWITMLCGRGILRRVRDPGDGRRVFVELSEATAKGIADYFECVRVADPLV